MTRSKNFTIDDLAAMTERQFEALENQLEVTHGEMQAGFAEMRAGFGKVRQSLSKIDDSIGVLAGEIAGVRVDHEDRLKAIEKRVRLTK